MNTCDPAHVAELERHLEVKQEIINSLQRQLQDDFFSPFLMTGLRIIVLCVVFGVAWKILSELLNIIDYRKKNGRWPGFLGPLLSREVRLEEETQWSVRKVGLLRRRLEEEAQITQLTNQIAAVLDERAPAAHRLASQFDIED